MIFYYYGFLNSCSFSLPFQMVTVSIAFPMQRPCLRICIVTFWFFRILQPYSIIQCLTVLGTFILRNKLNLNPTDNEFSPRDETLVRSSIPVQNLDVSRHRKQNGILI